MPVHIEIWFSQNILTLGAAAVYVGLLFLTERILVELISKA